VNLPPAAVIKSSSVLRESLRGSHGSFKKLSSTRSEQWHLDKAPPSFDLGAFGAAELLGLAELS